FRCSYHSCNIRLFFESSGEPRDLHSFPTRRSSDLGAACGACECRDGRRAAQPLARHPRGAPRACPCGTRDRGRDRPTARADRRPDRKSTRLKLQSLAYLVCRLLLEKKKKINTNKYQ